MLLPALVLLVSPAWGQFGGPAPTPSIPPVKSDLPFIRCGVCEALAKNAYRQVKAARDKLKPGKKVCAVPLGLPSGLPSPSPGATTACLLQKHACTSIPACGPARF